MEAKAMRRADKTSADQESEGLIRVRPTEWGICGVIGGGRRGP